MIYNIYIFIIAIIVFMFIILFDEVSDKFIINKHKYSKYDKITFVQLYILFILINLLLIWVLFL